MTNENENQRNISPEAMEEGEKKAVSSENKTAFDAKNYLNDRLSNGELSKQLKIRLLPIEGKAFLHIHMHSVKVDKKLFPTTKGWKNYVCLSKTDGPFSESLGKKCPFCEANHEYFEKYKNATTEADKNHYKTLSLACKSNEVGIVRCIERGHEEDGPKFWKFNLRTDKKDPESLIRSLYKTRKQESIDIAFDKYGVDKIEDLPEDFVPLNISDLENGKDLLITITAQLGDDGKPNGKRTIDIADYGGVKPITRDPELKEKWLNDTKKWSDVFVAKPYEYLKIIMDGKTPWFDNTQKKWVPKEIENNEEEYEDEV